MTYLQYDFITINAEQQEQLIALLSEQSFEGFEEDEHELSAFIKADDFDEAAFNKTIDLFSTLTYTRSEVENINWNQQWEQDFKPVIVDDFVAIRAHFHEPITNVDHEIIITPKMSFGTGHHATTHMMVQQMRHIDFAGKRVLDFGTGTGVLAILAEQLGAADTLAIDNDEWSIVNAQENIEQNNCSKIRVELMNEVPTNEQFDVIIANINLNVIVPALPVMAQVTSAERSVVLSGFLKLDEPTVKEAIAAAGLQYVSTMQSGDWISILAR